MKPANRNHALLIFSVIIGAGVRLGGIFSRPIWYDEAFALLLSHKGPGAVLQATLGAKTSSAAADIHPPLYYFLLWLWTLVFSDTITSARFFSILISIFTIVLVYIFASELINHTAGFISSLFVALLPFQVHFGVEIRMYALLAFWLSFSAFAFYKGRKTRHGIWWVIFSIAAAMAQYTHNLAIFFLIPLASIALFTREKRIVRNTLFAGMGAILLYLPWLIQIPAQFSKIEQAYWITRPTFASFFNLVLTYVTNLPLPKQLLIPGLIISLFCVIFPIIQTYKAVRLKTPDYLKGLLLGYMAFSPAIFLWLFSQWIPVYLERAMLPAHIMFCIWMAWALTQPTNSRLGQGLVSGLLLIGIGIGLVQHYTYQGFPYAPFQALTTSLADNIKPDDLILHSNKLSYLPALYYSPDLPQAYITDEPGSGSDTLAKATREVLELNASNDIAAATQGKRDVFFMIFRTAIEEYQAAGFETHPHLNYLNENYQLISVNEFGDLLLFKYSGGLD